MSLFTQYLIIIVCTQIYFTFFNFTKRNRFIKKELLRINTMKGFEFDEYLAVLLKQNGYSHVEVTPQYNDYGINLIAQKNEVTLGIYCGKKTFPTKN